MTPFEHGQAAFAAGNNAPLRDAAFLVAYGINIDTMLQWAEGWAKANMDAAILLPVFPNDICYTCQRCEKQTGGESACTSDQKGELGMWPVEWRGNRKTKCADYRAQEATHATPPTD